MTSQVRPLFGLSDPSWRWPEALLAFLAFLALSLFLLHTWVLQPQTDARLSNDAGVMAWNLWHATETTLRLENPFITNMMFYPGGSNLTQHTYHYGYMPIALLVRFLTGASLLYPYIAFRVTLLLAFALLGTFAYLLFRECGARVSEAALPAVAWMSLNYFVRHMHHLHHLAVFFVPLLFLLLVRVIRSPSTGRICALTGTAALSLYFTEFGVLIPLMIVLILPPLLIQSESRQDLWTILKRLRLAPAIAGLIVLVLVAGPFLFAYVQSEPLPPAGETADKLSANLVGFFVPSVRFDPLYGGFLHGLFTSSLEVTPVSVMEDSFLGYFLILLGFIGFLAAVKHPMGRALGFVTFGLFLFALGPDLKIGGRTWEIPMLFPLMQQVPPYNQFRAPDRLVVFIALFLGGFAVIALRLLRRRLIPISKGTWWYAFVVTGLAVWVMVEAYAPESKPGSIYPIPPPELARKVQAETAPGPVAVLPTRLTDPFGVQLQMFHGQPIVSGWLSRRSQKHLEQVEGISRAFGVSLRNGNTAAVEEILQVLGVRTVIAWGGNVPDWMLESLRKTFTVVDVRQYYPRRR